MSSFQEQSITVWVGVHSFYTVLDVCTLFSSGSTTPGQCHRHFSVNPKGPYTLCGYGRPWWKSVNCERNLRLSIQTVVREFTVRHLHLQLIYNCWDQRQTASKWSARHVIWTALHTGHIEKVTLDLQKPLQNFLFHVLSDHFKPNHYLFLIKCFLCPNLKGKILFFNPDLIFPCFCVYVTNGKTDFLNLQFEVSFWNLVRSCRKTALEMLVRVSGRKCFVEVQKP